MDGGAWWAAVHGVAKSQTRLSDFTFTFHFHALEKEMATHSSVLAWRIPGTAEPVGCHLWGRTELDTTEVTWRQQQQQQQQPFAVYAINISPSCPQILLLLLRYSWCTILRKFLLYNIVIHNFPVFFGHTTRHEELPQPGIKPVPLAVEARLLTTRLPGKSYVVYFKYTQSYLSIVPQ